MAPFNVFRVFGGSNRPPAHVYPAHPGTTSSVTSGRRVLRRRDRRFASAQPPQVAYPPTLTAISEDDLSRLSMNDIDEPLPNQPNMTHETLLESEPGAVYGPPDEIQPTIQSEQVPRAAHFIEPTMNTHHTQLHEEFLQESDEEPLDDEHDHRESHVMGEGFSHSSTPFARESHAAPYMGRVPTPYHPPDVTIPRSASGSQLHPSVQSAPPPERTSEHLPHAAQDYMTDASIDAMAFSSRLPGTYATREPQYVAYGSSSRAKRVPSTHRHGSISQPKQHYNSTPRADANNTYCYIVPRGTNVIFQDEDGYEITRVGSFLHPHISREPPGYQQSTRKRTVPIVVQDEFGQELYRTGSITHGSYDESASRRAERRHRDSGSHPHRSRSMSHFPNHSSLPSLLPYQHNGPNVVLVDRNGRQIPIATNPYRTTREVQSERYY